MDLYEKLNRVCDKESFVAFLKALSNDFETSYSEWQNGSISSYLECISAWAVDYKKEDFNWDNPGYKEMAILFYMGKIYE